jgi:hypothetical protein
LNHRKFEAKENENLLTAFAIFRVKVASGGRIGSAANRARPHNCGCKWPVCGEN